MKQLVIVILLFVVSRNGFAQAITLTAGHSLLPGDYYSIGYEHYSNGAINGKLSLFAEKARKNGINYSSYGIDLMAEYASNQNEQTLFAFRLGLGATGQLENEPWIYQSLSGSRKWNYGATSELSGEWWMSDHFCLSVFGQQKWLFNSELGKTRFAFGIGLKFHFDSN